MNKDFSNYRIGELTQKFPNGKLNIMVVGGTGVGKSTTLNAILQKSSAKIGEGVNPETQNVVHYDLNKYIRFWDTPGFGDSPEADKRHEKKIIQRIYLPRKDAGKSFFSIIDCVLVLADGSGRDLGTTYKMLRKVIIPNIQPERIFVAINQCDIAMSGRHWNESENCPDETLLNFLVEKSVSVKNRIEKNTAISLKNPICYSAKTGWNMEKLLDFLIDNTPVKMRPIRFSEHSREMAKRFCQQKNENTDDSNNMIVAAISTAINTKQNSYSNHGSDSSDFSDDLADLGEILTEPFVSIGEAIGDFFSGLFDW